MVNDNWDKLWRDYKIAMDKLGISEELKKKQPTKLQWHLLPWDCLEEIVKVLEKGNEKYTPDSWKKNNKIDYLDAALRHIKAILSGEKTDEEGLSHAACAAASLLFVIWFENEENH